MSLPAEEVRQRKRPLGLVGGLAKKLFGTPGQEVR